MPSLGIDLLEIKKAESFYRAHRNRLADFLNPGERLMVRRHPKPHEALAALLASKEAVFKSLGASWMGLSGFKNIRMVPAGPNRFSFELKGALKRFRRPGASVRFSKKKDCILARCLS